MLPRRRLTPLYFITEKSRLDCDNRLICPSDFKVPNSDLHIKAGTSGMIEAMVNPFERIMRCIRFSVKLSLRGAYSL